jgi:alkylation response protein AidB-like acyl-CoA dehydrogenase
VSKAADSYTVATANPDTVIVYAKTNPEAGPHGITAFIVEKGMLVRSASGLD